MSDLPEDLDLKFLPDWLKEAPAANRYADFLGEPEGRPRDRNRDRDRGPRPRPTSDRPARDERGPRKPGGSSHGDRRQGPPRGEQGPRKGGARPWERDRGPRPEPVTPAAVRIDFLPEPNALAAIAKQIRSGARSYPLFGTARLFLERPERYRVRLSATEPGGMLFQVADGPIAFDRAAVERDAFRVLKPDHYREEVVQGEPPKGNFRNVARVRGTGALIGPTNYHSYQPTLRKIYEERFSRRMSFPDFQQHEIEIVTDEQTINDWKEQVRSTVTYQTTQEAEPLTFRTAAEIELHFRKTYLPALVKSGPSLETSGLAVRATQDRQMLAALREAFERERGFPGTLVNHLRPAFVEAGLIFFKHRKRVIYVTPIRPHRHTATGPVAEGVAALLKAIDAAPRCKRHDLAVQILGPHADTPEFVERKTALAADLHYLIHAGHVIEFADATLDLPLLPKAQATEAAGTADEPDVAAETIPPRSTAIVPADLAGEVPAATTPAVAPPGAEPAASVNFVREATPPEPPTPMASEPEPAIAMPAPVSFPEAGTAPTGEAPPEA